jgi:hypothetical protein
VAGGGGSRHSCLGGRRLPHRLGGSQRLGWDQGDLGVQTRAPFAAAGDDRRLGAEGWAPVAGGWCCGQGARDARLRHRWEEQPNGSGGLAYLGHGLVLGRGLGQERIATYGGALWVAILVAKIQIEANPLAVVGTLGCRHPHLVQPPLKGGPYLWGTARMATLLAHTAHPRAGVPKRRASPRRRQPESLINRGLYNTTLEE